MTKNPKSSKKITNLCQRLRTDFDDWEKIPTKVKKDGSAERKKLYDEIKQKIEKLSD